ncbi:MAG: haloacid dehalogenase [Actinomycetota bacterium]|nr:haloacid dehalogenase [Actinomycetota bacterium]
MDLGALSSSSQQRFEEKTAAREKALSASRRSIRASANAIRAIHRRDFEQAGQLMSESRAALDSGKKAVADQLDVYYAGFLQDAQKEYAEAHLTNAVVRGTELPSPDDLEVELAPYLNGMAETIGEARRAILDLLRRGEIAESERILAAMEDMFYVLVSMDFPDAITGNLRRSTDVARGIMERTRGDLSITLVQRNLQDALERHARDVLGGG